MNIYISLIDISHFNVHWTLKVQVRSLRKTTAHQEIAISVALNKKHIEMLYLCSYRYKAELLYPFTS